MRFVTFEHQGQVRAGALYPPRSAGSAVRVIDGAHSHRPSPLQGLASEMLAWIEAGLVELSLAIKAETVAQSCLIPLDEVRLMAPLPRPGKIVGAAFNYRDGLAVSSRPEPKSPVLFVKSRSTVVGPDDVVQVLRGHEVTYEAELAAIIGSTALCVDTNNAAKHVCGYAIFNDVSYTDMVRQDGTFIRGKNQVTSGPLGPWIVSADDIDDPYNLNITLEIDDEVLQSSSTAQMLFRLPELIAAASRVMPLDPGDIIATGTPAGVAANHSPAAWLRKGHRMTIRITGLGELSNPVTETTI